MKNMKNIEKKRLEVAEVLLLIKVEEYRSGYFPSIDLPHQRAISQMAIGETVLCRRFEGGQVELYPYNFPPVRARLSELEGFFEVHPFVPLEMYAHAERQLEVWGSKFKELANAFKSPNSEYPYPVQVYVNNQKGAVAIKFSDGTCTSAVYEDSESIDTLNPTPWLHGDFSLEYGVLICLAKKLMGNWTSIEKLFNYAEGVAKNKLKDTVDDAHEAYLISVKSKKERYLRQGLINNIVQSFGEKDNK